MPKKDEPPRKVRCHNCNGSGTVIVYEKGKPKAITCGVCGGAKYV